ncbi:MAG: hypothetical protein ACI9LY_001858, partial [Arenicella sp.]
LSVAQTPVGVFATVTRPLCSFIISLTKLRPSPVLLLGELVA